MAEQIKLQNAGDSLTFQCTGASIAKTGKWPEAIFAGHDGAKEIVVHMPAQSAERQLTRLAMTYADCGNKTLTISRAPNHSDPNKPYWNLEVVGTHATSGPKKAQPFDSMPPEYAGGGAHTPAPPSKDSAPASLDNYAAELLYASITAFVLKSIVPMYVARGIALDMQAIAAIVNTNFIQANKH